MLRAIYRLIEQLIENHKELSGLRRQITHFQNRMEDHMATQEQRLQAILARVNETLALLNTLKDNNPDIEDEIAAIESALTGTGDDDDDDEPPV